MATESVIEIVADILKLFPLVVERSLIRSDKCPAVWTDGEAQPGGPSDMQQVRSEKIRDEEAEACSKSEVRRSEMEKLRQGETRCGCAKR